MNPFLSVQFQRVSRDSTAAAAYEYPVTPLVSLSELVREVSSGPIPLEPDRETRRGPSHIFRGRNPGSKARGGDGGMTADKMMDEAGELPEFPYTTMARGFASGEKIRPAPEMATAADELFPPTNDFRREVGNSDFRRAEIGEVALPVTSSRSEIITGKYVHWNCKSYNRTRVPVIDTPIGSNTCEHVG